MPYDTRGAALVDETDRKLLEVLHANARASFAELGQAVGLSAPSVHARVKRLERTGVIRGYRVVVDPALLGFPLGAFVAVSQASGYHWEDLERAFAAMPEVEECHSVTGEDSYLLKVRVADPAELEALLRRITMIEGVARTRTVVVLSTPFDRRRLR
jgi:Lrp/AsnC family leucine-responsive transcriptional regulator